MLLSTSSNKSMSDELSLSKFQFGENTFDVIVLKDGEENESYFIGNEVARALGYGDPNGAVQRHCPDRIAFSDLRTTPAETAGVLVFRPNTSMITETDIISLIFCSQLPQAKEFRKFVSKVIKCIWKHGCYPPPELSVPQIQYVEKPHKEKMIAYQTMQCGCVYTPGAGTMYEQCSCPNKDLRIQKRRENVAQGELLKGGVPKSSGKKGGLKTQENNRQTKRENIKLRNDLGDANYKIAELELLLLNLNLIDDE